MNLAEVKITLRLPLVAFYTPGIVLTVREDLETFADKPSCNVCNMKCDLPRDHAIVVQSMIKFAGKKVLVADVFDNDVIEVCDSDKKISFSWSPPMFEEFKYLYKEKCHLYR